MVLHWKLAASSMNGCIVHTWLTMNELSVTWMKYCFGWHILWKRLMTAIWKITFNFRDVVSTKCLSMFYAEINRQTCFINTFVIMTLHVCNLLTLFISYYWYDMELQMFLFTQCNIGTILKCLMCGNIL